MNGRSIMPGLDAWLVRAALAGRPLNGLVADASDAFRPIVEALAEQEDAGQRAANFKAFLAGRRDAAEVRAAVEAADPTGTPPIGRDGDDEDDAPIEPGALDDWPAAPGGAAFSGPAGEFALAVAPYTEADPAAVLVAVLVGFGNLVGRTAHYAIGGGSRHYANTFCVLVGPSSVGRKGTAMSLARDLLRRVDAEWADGRVRSGLTSGEGLIFHVRDAVEGREPIRENRRIVDYQTVVTDPGVADKRLLAWEPEFGRTLKVAAREGATLSAVAREAFDGGNLGTLTRSNSLVATGAHVGILGCITRSELLAKLTDDDTLNGFGNRFLWIATRRSRRLPFGDDGGMPDFTPFAVRLQLAANHARECGAIGWAPEARPLWEVAYDRLTAERPGRFGAITGRAEAHVVRLALAYAVLDRAVAIGPEHLRAALALWDYAERSARWIFGEATGDRHADRIAEALRAAGATGLTRTAITREVFGGNLEKLRLDRALATLLRSQVVERIVEAGSRGRPRERWRLTNLRTNETNEVDELTKTAPAGGFNASSSSASSSSYFVDPGDSIPGAVE